ncbi:YiiX/YebB-like N1pC/P60 family cysteine hydrolase [Pseudohongiella sp.]|uniref:Lipo-like protein n=1 Tax=marine sediment metagenome TaxID=412755 RepID=A0A0F9WJP7_9ZZZZ|nr:YiiX/YebB-like N1pC/P60 family cysteine hydrolase [Pseudohongiella sp.]HDZ08167.1 lipo-like protein [Pseudohongiella sp.]HEA63135.1 lipo-like protein [Pseudohongiella sp.]
MESIPRAIGRRLAAYLSKPRPGYERLSRLPLQDIMDTLQPADIVLVDGNSHISTAIKYLTQSTWSHACLYVGAEKADVEQPSLIEADLNDGVTQVPLRKYEQFNLRICRPVGLSAEDKASIIAFARARVGHVYDLKNIFDLARYLIQSPAVPVRYRRDLITFGSGEPTRAICSTLIAEAYQEVGYPILPEFIRVENKKGEAVSMARHFTHYVPGDFDLSPYFSIIKPTIEHGFSLSAPPQSE